MKKCIEKWVACALTAVLCVTMTGWQAPDSNAKTKSKPGLSVKKVTVNVGKTKKVKVQKAKGYKVTWKSNKKSVASVKKSGKYACKITGKSKGNAVITCKLKKGKKTYSRKCKVLVTQIQDKKASQLPVTTQPASQAPAQPTDAAPASTSPAQTSVPTLKVPETILEGYSRLFGYVGTCANYDGWQTWGRQLQDADTVNFIKKHFNSFTLENEMKPEAILQKDWQSKDLITITKSKAEELGYVIPDGYTEEKVPKLNFDKIDKVLELAYKEGLKMRAHVLMWHQQTPSAFFAADYSMKKDVVTPEVMDVRTEFFIRSVMTHILEKEKELTGSAGSIVYAWDVVNEYIHRDNRNRTEEPYSWVEVYTDMGLQPSYVKKAFQEAYGILKKYNVQDKVTLFYNDYDTYFCSDDVVELVNFINEGEEAKICGGIGMQSHVDVDRPTLEEYGAALEKFLNTGLEVQITELDVTINFDHEKTFSYKDEKQTAEDQAKFVGELMDVIISKHQNRNQSVSPKGITGLTIWGMCDEESWRDKMEPLLFTWYEEKDGVRYQASAPVPKPSYYSFLNAAKYYE